MKDRQIEMAKIKMTNNGRHNTTQKTQDKETINVYI